MLHDHDKKSYTKIYKKTFFRSSQYLAGTGSEKMTGSTGTRFSVAHWTSACLYC